MMKVKHIRKVLALVLALALAPPLLDAQSDGFFGSYSEGARDGGSGSGMSNQAFGNSQGGSSFGIGNQTFGDPQGDDSYGITNQAFGQDAPVGGGIAILVASAAGYTLLKRRKSSKHQTPNNLKHLNS